VIAVSQKRPAQPLASANRASRKRQGGALPASLPRRRLTGSGLLGFSFAACRATFRHTRRLPRLDPAARRLRGAEGDSPAGDGLPAGCPLQPRRNAQSVAVHGRCASLPGPVAPDHVGVVDGIVGSGIPQRRDDEATQAPALLRLFVAGRDRGRGFHEMMQRRTHRPKGQDRSVVDRIDPGAFQGQASFGHVGPPISSCAVTKSPA